MTIQVLKVLSDIWKSGAEMNLDSDGKIELKNHQLVPAETMKAAESIFPEIEKWFHSWKTESSENITIRKALYQYCGWQRNEKLNEWLLGDETSLFMLHDWTVVLAKNGWQNIYEDHRNYENDESIKMGQELYKRAVMYAKKGE
ncbi:hypothetical protein [Psychrobacillus sp. BM2]|uniref:hypothetical protein n=1 Tax=Psychrobacillus sp. BM2 TaxID=3400421 RepID=UPI003B01B26C